MGPAASRIRLPRKTDAFCSAILSSIALAKEGAEIVALPSETSETVRPSGYAQQHRYYIVSATPKEHAAVYNPMGIIQAQATQAGVLGWCGGHRVPG